MIATVLIIAQATNSTSWWKAPWDEPAVAFALAVLVLIVAALAALYTRRDARTNARLLRDESDAAQSTKFDIQKNRPPQVFVVNMNEPPRPHSRKVCASNVGEADASDVKLVVTADDGDTGEGWNNNDDLLSPSQKLCVRLGELESDRVLTAKVTWKDGRRRRQSHSRQIKT